MHALLKQTKSMKTHLYKQPLVVLLKQFYAHCTRTIIDNNLSAFVYMCKGEKPHFSTRGYVNSEMRKFYSLMAVSYSRIEQFCLVIISMCSAGMRWRSTMFLYRSRSFIFSSVQLPTFYLAIALDCP